MGDRLFSCHSDLSCGNLLKTTFLHNHGRINNKMSVFLPQNVSETKSIGTPTNMVLKIMNNFFSFCPRGRTLRHVLRYRAQFSPASHKSIFLFIDYKQLIKSYFSSKYIYFAFQLAL